MLKLIIFVDLSQINKFVTNLTTTNSIEVNVFVAVNLSFIAAEKRVMSNNITIYENFSIYNRLSIVIEAYFEIWRNFDETINISKKKLNNDFNNNRCKIKIS